MFMMWILSRRPLTTGWNNEIWYIYEDVTALRIP